MLSCDNIRNQRGIMYCTYCGRDEGNQCHCHYNKKIHTAEGWILLIIFLMIPFVTSALLLLNDNYSWPSFARLTTLGVSGYLIIIAFLTWIFKKSYLALFFGCHQKIERTYKIFGHPLNICARCTGIYTGVLMVNLIFLVIQPSIVLLILSLPLILDGLIQKKTSYVSTNLRRLMTGILFGPSLILIFAGIHHMIIISIRFFL